MRRTGHSALWAIPLASLWIAGGAIAQTPLEELGEFLYFDEDLSDPAGQACASCHEPEVGFDDPDSDLPVSEGVIPGLFGGRNSPISAYAMYAPSLYFDEAEGLWIGGQGPGLFHLKNDRIDRTINHQQDGLSNDSVRSIYDDGEGNLYVGTISGFNHFKDGKLERIYTREDDLPDDRDSAIVPTGDGTYWLATPGGLAHFDGITIEEYVPTDNVSQNRVVYLYLENEERLWIGTLEGPIVYQIHVAR